MIDYGAAPESEEVEVVVFGPGYGEAVAVHLGEGDWMLVDSCIDPNSRRPAALTYLDGIGVLPSQVSTIVASHWHDDHVKGIATVARACSNAEVNISAAFNDEEATTFLAAYSGKITSGLSGGSRELHEVISSGIPTYLAKKRCSIRERISHGRQVRVTAVSPVDAALAEMVRRFASLIPKSASQSPIRKAIPLKPNIESVALHVDFGDGAVLLGSDLEQHSSMGWAAVISDPWCRDRTKATAYKLAHHGSKSGDAADIWNVLLSADPICIATPFNRGNQRLPTDDDRARIKANTTQGFISSGAARKASMDSQILKRLSDITKSARTINNGFGAVRIRRKLGHTDWQVQCFGDACAI